MLALFLSNSTLVFPNDYFQNVFTYRNETCQNIMMKFHGRRFCGPCSSVKMTFVTTAIFCANLVVIIGAFSRVVHIIDSVVAYSMLRHQAVFHKYLLMNLDEFLCELGTC